MVHPVYHFHREMVDSEYGLCLSPPPRFDPCTEDDRSKYLDELCVSPRICDRAAFHEWLSTDG